jgi:hypothetical protein
MHPEKKGISSEDLKGLRPGDTAVSVSKRIGHHYQVHIDLKAPGEELDYTDILDIIYSTFKKEIMVSVILFHLDAIFRLSFSFMIVQLFRAVAEQNWTAYIYVPILAVLWYISQLFKQLGALNTSLLSEQIKSGYAMLIYAKLSKLTAYVLNPKEVGKISNLIANDLTIIDQRTSSLLSATASPLMLVGVTVILYIRIGWPCLLGMAFILIVVPLIMKISKVKTRIVKKAN